ncbi:MAG: calcium-binding EGF-like domain-containing protein [Chitinophagales bacterium]
MKQATITGFIVVFGFLFLVMTSVTSCKKNDQDACGLTCENGGICVIDTINGNYCDCAFGYLGDNCETFDLCSSLDCEAGGGTCVSDGKGGFVCDCPNGFEGDCTTEIRDKYIGEFKTKDICSIGGNYSYTVTVVPIEGELMKVRFENFGGLLSSVTANLKAKNRFEIPNQNDGTGRFFESIGDGVIGTVTHTMNLNYKVTFDDGSFETCELSLEQK